MACISCGVMTSAWLCRICSLWVSAIRGLCNMVRFLLLCAYNIGTAVASRLDLRT